jgi:hypothetical protein
MVRFILPERGYKRQMPYFQWFRINGVPLAVLLIYRAEDTASTFMNFREPLALPPPDVPRYKPRWR